MHSRKLGRRLAALVCLGGLWLGGCASTPAAPPATAEGRQGSASSAPVSIPLQPLRVRLRTVTAKVGSHTGKFLLDTAGGLTLITPEFAQKVGCAPWGRITGFGMMGNKFETPQCNDVRFELPGITVTAPVVPVFDFNSLFAKDAEPLDGLIALDVFAGQAVTLDVGHDRLIVETPESLVERTRTMREGQARIAREVMGSALSVFTAVPTPKGTAWFELDSGNGGTILVSKHIAPLLGLDAKVEQPQATRFELVGGASVEGNAHVPDMIIDGNLGMPFLSKWVVTMDLARSRVWFQPSTPGEGSPTPSR